MQRSPTAFPSREVAACRSMSCACSGGFWDENGLCIADAFYLEVEIAISGDDIRGFVEEEGTEANVVSLGVNARSG